MPSRQRVQGDEPGKAHQIFPTNAPGLEGQAFPLVIVELWAPSELFLEHANFLLEVFDGLLLAAVHPTRNAGHHDRKRISNCQLYCSCTICTAGRVIDENIPRCQKNNFNRSGSALFVDAKLRLAYLSRGLPGTGVIRNQSVSSCSSFGFSISFAITTQFVA